MSGGRATIQNRSGGANLTQLGDITCVHPRGSWITEQYFIECKFYRDLDVASSLLMGRGRLAAFWNKLVLDASSKGRHPLLIAKENNRETLVLATCAPMSVTERDRSPRTLAVSHTLISQPFVCLFHEMFPIRKVRRK